jgi:hypothetical protein
VILGADQGERPKFGSQTGARPANLPELRVFLSPGKPGRFAGTGWWVVPGSNRGPHHDALWNSHFNIRLWETEFRAQRLPGKFDGRALQLPKNSGQRPSRSGQLVGDAGIEPATLACENTAPHASFDLIGFCFAGACPFSLFVLLFVGPLHRHEISVRGYATACAGRYDLRVIGVPY